MHVARKTSFPVLLALLLCLPVSASAQVEDAARAAFARMANSIESAKTLSVQAYVSYDVVQPTGQKLQFHASNSVQLARPDRLHATSLREGTERELWFRGGTLHLHDRTDGTHGSITGPAEIDGMLDLIAQKYNLSMPLADLLYSDIDQSMLDSALSGTLAGETMVEGVRCQHLAFTQEQVDWQIWLEAGERALPRKIVITYKNEPGMPQFVATLWDWSLDPQLPASLFEFVPPAGSVRAEMVPMNVPRPPKPDAR